MCSCGIVAARNASEARVCLSVERRTYVKVSRCALHLRVALTGRCSFDRSCATFT